MCVLFPDYPPSIRSSDTICSQKKSCSISCSGCLDFEVQSLFYSFVIGSHLNLKKKAFCAVLLFLVLPSASVFLQKLKPCADFSWSLISTFFSCPSTSGIIRTRRGKNNQIQPPKYNFLMCICFKFCNYSKSSFHTVTFWSLSRYSNCLSIQKITKKAAVFLHSVWQRNIISFSNSDGIVMV